MNDPQADPAKPRRVVINGANGRMGQQLMALAKADPELELIGGADVEGDLARIIHDAEVVVDFSLAASLDELLRLAQPAGTNLVIGTTGHSNAQLQAVRDASEKLTVVMAPNFSVGVNTLFWATEKVASILGPDFDLEVTEIHHHHKLDAPSGTAKRLGEILARVRELNYESQTTHGRSGMVGARPKEEIGMHALRGGDVVGDHTVYFLGGGERVELTHRAGSREAFALGALRAAKWAVKRPAGLYDMQDVLGLRAL